MNGLKDNSAWLALETHSEIFKRNDFRLLDLFKSDEDRFEKFSLCHEGLLLDFSKNLINRDSMSLLNDLAEQRQLAKAIADMFSGEEINTTEQRAARHVALRAPSGASELPEVARTLDRMAALVHALHSGAWLGHSGERITDVVNIGIGGSDLGPAMVCDSLEHFADTSTRLHFVSNIDPSHLSTTLKKLRAETTLFIVASKSFTTLETIKNAERARSWLMQGGSGDATAKHFVAITTNLSAASKFGIAEDNLFPMWDWVGGRYSLWSAIGLPVALAVGMDGFRQLLAGAHSMDEHFRTAPLPQNIPVISALISVWYREYFNAHSTAVVPYSQRLNAFPSFLQQLCMESLGKSVDLDGNPLERHTGDIIWGSAGTNSQHSYFQLLHQGTEFIPVDLIAIAKTNDVDEADSHKQLLANCFSQSLALMKGVRDKEFPHKSVVGNKPSNSLLIEALNPYNLGMLIALYEHKVYALSVLWNINAFDQWGVELGKSLSSNVLAVMDEDKPPTDLDASTTGLLRRARDWGSN